MQLVDAYVVTITKLKERIVGLKRLKVTKMKELNIKIWRNKRGSLEFTEGTKASKESWSNTNKKDILYRIGVLIDDLGDENV